MKTFTCSFLILFSITITSCGQSTPAMTSGFVEYRSIEAPVHKANIGKLTFTSEIIPLKDYTESDFLSSYELHDNSELYIRAFFDNSLTNYLHEVDTTLTAEQLTQNGNYQLSFYVDGDLLYKENIVKGAGSPASKNENTILLVPLLSKIYTDFWSRFTWMRFYYRNGGEAALENGSHMLKIEIRPYLDNGKVITGDIMAQGEIRLKMADPEPVSEEQIAIQKIKAGSGWKLSGADYDEEKIRSLNERIAQNRFKDITSIVVIKNSNLLIEEYFNGAERETLHDTRSVGKSFASTMTGIAIQEGYLKNTNQTLNEFYDLTTYKNYSSAKELVTLKSLLTMSSGFDGSDNDYNSPGNEENMYPTSNWVKFALDLSMDKEKKTGENWDYFTAGVVVLGDIIDKSVPGGLEAYAHEKLFKPLGIVDYQWQYTPQDVANTAGGLEMKSLDFARYGQLYKNKGIWDGKSILVPEWINETFTNHFDNDPEQTPYGFLFWNRTFTINGQSYEAFLCSGNGGNKIIIFKDQPLVIVITATAYNQPYAHSQVDKMLQNYILPAVIENANQSE